MSAGFDFAGHVHWGTNGAIETYLEALSQAAAERFGTDDRLAVAFRKEREGFFTGAIVFLDDILTEVGERRRFVRLLEASTEKLLLDGAFTEHGRAWVETEIRALQGRIANFDPPQSDA